MTEEKCACGMPLTEETKCNCKPDNCAICCECSEDCQCGCVEKSKKIKEDNQKDKQKENQNE